MISTILYTRPRLCRTGSWVCSKECLTGWLYFCAAYFEINFYTSTIYSDDVCPIRTLSCSRFWTLKMPRLSSGVDYAPVVNNSRIEWTKLHQLEDACYLVVGTNTYWFDCFICFTSKVHFTNFESQIFDVIVLLYMCFQKMFELEANY